MTEPEDQSVSKHAKPMQIERIQTGVRLEKRMLKVLKALAEYLDLSLSDLLEGIVLHSFENKPPFSQETLQVVARLKEVYLMDYGTEASHNLIEGTSVAKVEHQE